jgi:pilus assembly protein Flp/PilA
MRNARKRVAARLRELFRSQDGPTATEYAVMLALLLMTAIGAIGIFGTSLSSLFADIQTTLFA